MRRNRIILGTLALPVLLAVPAPAALAGGPLLSGYGGPGAGAQAIIGGTLLNGPKGGSGGGSGGSAGGSSSQLLCFLFLSFLLLVGDECKPRCKRSWPGRRLGAPVAGARAQPSGTVARESRQAAGHPLGALARTRVSRTRKPPWPPR